MIIKILSKMDNDSFQVIEKTRLFLIKSAFACSIDNSFSKNVSHSLLDCSTRQPIDSNLSSKFCKRCGSVRTGLNTTYRVKPKQKDGQNVQKAIHRQRLNMVNSRKTSKTLNKFIKSTSLFVIKCKSCGYYDQIKACSRSDIIILKNEERKRITKIGTDSPTSFLRKNTSSFKRKSIESFISTSITNERKWSPSPNVKNKKKRLSHLSQLLSDEDHKSPNTSLTDFLQNLH